MHEFHTHVDQRELCEVLLWHGKLAHMYVKREGRKNTQSGGSLLTCLVCFGFWVSWNLFCRLGSQRFICLCFLSSGIKDMHHLTWLLLLLLLLLARYFKPTELLWIAKEGKSRKGGAGNAWQHENHQAWFALIIKSTYHVIRGGLWIDRLLTEPCLPLYKIISCLIIIFYLKKTKFTVTSS